MESQSPEVTFTQKSVDLVRPGDIEFKVHKARQIESKGYPDPDPYVFLTFGSQQFKSKTVKNEPNPEWEFTTKFAIDELSPNQINIAVFDDDFGKDENLGATNIDINDILNRSQIINEWVALKNCKTGEVQISAQFMPADALTGVTDKSLNEPSFEIISQSDVEVDFSTKVDTEAKDILIQKDITGKIVPMKIFQETKDLKSSMLGETRVMDLPTDMKKAETGNLIFTLVGAKNLVKSDYFGKSDPYAVVQYKEEIFKSKTINNDLNPVWNFLLTFKIIEADTDVIHIQVFDEDYDQDDELGKTTIRVKDLIDCKTIDDRWVKLEDCKSGEIQFSSKYSPIIIEDISKVDSGAKDILIQQDITGKIVSEKIVQKTQELESSMLDETRVMDLPTDITKAETGNLNFTLVGAKNLENSDYIGKSDPYVVVQYREETFKSKTINNDLNPVWNFSLTFKIIEADTDVIYIQVFDEDYDKDDELGKTTISVKDLIDCKTIAEKWVKLENCKSGEIQFSSKYSPIIIEEIRKETTEELSSVTGKLEFDLMTTRTKYDITETFEDQSNVSNITPSHGYSQNFDKIVKKSCKKIIRRIDSDGNVIEEVVEEGRNPENWETSTMDMSSGIEVVTGHSKITSIKKTIDEYGNVISEDVQTSYEKDPKIDFEQLHETGFSAIPIKKTSTKTTKRVIKRIDDEGNITEELIEEDNGDIIPDLGTRISPVSIKRTSTQTSRKIIKRIDNDGNVTEEIISETGEEPNLFSDDLKSQFFSPHSVNLEQIDSSSFPQTITTKKSTSSRKIIRTVDSEGNVTEKIINEGDTDTSMDDNEFKNQFMSSIPLTTRTSVSSTRIVKMIDSEGNVTERIMKEGDDDNLEIDEDNFKANFMSRQPITTKTSMTSTKIIKTVDSEGNVTEKIINEGDRDFTADEDGFRSSFFSSIPVALQTTSLQTTRKIIRKTDEFGNITEEIIDDPVTEASKWDQIPTEKSFDMKCTTVKRTIDASGNVLDENISVSQPDDLSENFESFRNLNIESSLPSAVKRTSVTTTKRVIKRLDDKGNVIEEIVDDNDPIIESEMWKRASGDFPTSLQVTSTSTSMTTVKRTVDEHGNVVNEETSTIESKDPQTRSQVSEVFSENLTHSSIGKEIHEIHENGKLIFTLHSAKSLENKDWMGKSDPYAVISLGQIIFKTETISNNLNPEFEQEMVFQINATSPSAINIELFDEDITRDECLGNTAIDIMPIKKQGKISNQTKVLSNCKSGEIIYSAEFIPEAKDIFTDSSIDISQKAPRKPKPVDGAKGGNEEENMLLLRMSDLGIENIELVSGDKENNEDVLLKDVIDLQASTKEKISGLMKTIKQVELDTSEASPEVYTKKFSLSRKIDSQGNVVEEILEGGDIDVFDSELGITRTQNISQTTMRKTVKILDKEGNIIEEREVDTSGDPNAFDLNMLRNISAQTTVTNVVMDGQGNVINETVQNMNVGDPEEYAKSIQRSFVSSPESSKSSFVIRKEFSSESEKSPTFEDVVYSEYPHLTRPMDQSFDSLSSNVTTSSHSARYFHSSNEPFQNITSLRAHFVQAFDRDVPDTENTESETGLKDVKYDDPFNNFFGKSNFTTTSSSSESTQFFSSSTQGFSGSEFGFNKLAVNEDHNKEQVLGSKNTPFYMLASEEPSLEELVSESSVSSWMEPIISGNCLVEKEFWNSSDNIPASNIADKESSQVHAFFSSSSHSSSPDQYLMSGPNSLRSPVSMLKSNSPVLSFQSLPSSPRKQVSVKKVITSELFSSDKDISRSLELIYTEPNEDQIYKTGISNKEIKSLEKRKPSFTQLKRPSTDAQINQYEILSMSPSPEWGLSERKSVDFTPCDLSNEYSFQTKSSSNTQSIQISPSSPQECQISKDICSKDPPCCKLFDPKSQTSVRSPERKFQYVQGLEEQFSANVEQKIVTAERADVVTKLTENIQTGLKESLNQHPTLVLDNVLSREQSFVYDTSVEAFSSKGAFVDESYCDFKLVEEETVPAGISIIGQIAKLGESTDDKIEIVEFIESNTLSKESQVEKFEYIEEKDFDFNEEDISFSPDERPESGLSEIIEEDRPDNLIIPLSSSPLKVETLFLTESCESQSNSPKTETGYIEIPKHETQNRRLSNISIEDGNKISSTPEGETYFMKREESFIAKVDKGEVEHLAVEISEYYNLQTPTTENELCVKPVESTPETEIEIRDFRSASNLTVKPIDQVVRRIPVSSYEQIYDSVSIEDIGAHSKMSTAEIMSSLGDRFQGTHEMPEFVSSFEDLYQRSAEGLADEIVSSALRASTELPGERWSAPAGAIEPPILEASEFSIRFDPLQDKIENHWEAIEIMMSTETLTGQEQASSKKPSSK
eukprot:GFUD01098953.1.p1 GENE.GFUD01098953.1~~GFUD01098953.1.p1  ORF type:complete len:2477 (-),score=634.93 GFUD01098953.1:598-7686(-)